MAEGKKGLTAKQAAFVEAYLATFNATEAARQANYGGTNASLAVIGWENLRKLNIAESIKQRLSESAMSADEVLMRLAEHARADVGTWTSDDGTINLAEMKRQNATRIIRKVKRTERSGVSAAGTEWSNVTVEIELHDAQAALVQLAKHHGLLSEQLDHSGEIVITVQYANEATDSPATKASPETA